MSRPAHRLSELLGEDAPATLRTWTGASPSQITAFRRCALRWWWQSVAGIRPPSPPSAQLGIDVHAQIERYIQHGTPFAADKAGQIASAGMAYYPQPGSDPSAQRIERSFRLPTTYASAPGWPLSLTLSGRIDYVSFGSVYDWKTTSDFRYAKATEQLQSDPQAVIYTWALRQAGEITGRASSFCHVYLRTTAPHKAMEVSVDLSERRVTDEMDLLREEDLPRMVAASRQDDPAAVGHNLSACGDYGGCPHRDRCARVGVPVYGAGSSLLTLVNNKETTNMAFNPLDLILGNKKPAAAPAAPVEEPTPAPAQEKPQTSAEQRAQEWEEQAALITRALAIGKRYGLDNAATMAAWKQHTNGVSWPEGLTDTLLDAFEAAMAGPAAEPAVNPPDGTPYEEVTTADQADPVAQAKDPVLPDGRRLASVKKDEMEQVHRDLLAQAAERGLTADYRKASTLPAKPKRTELKEDVILLLDLLGGRAKAPAPVQPEPVEQQVEPVAPAAPAKEPPPEPVEPVASVSAHPADLRAGEDADRDPVSLLSVLALDCAGHGTTLADWRLLDGRPVLRTLQDAVCSQLGVTHYSTPDYRKGERLVVEGLARMLRDGQCEPVDVLLLGAGNMDRDPGLRELLSQHAAFVVRGVAG